MMLSTTYRPVSGSPAAPTVINASTTYGLDLSSSNNYGLGGGYQSTHTQFKAIAARKNAPSLWWLAGFFFLVAVL
jgi:hypothetical protein